jgi:hypothetical protein
MVAPQQQKKRSELTDNNRIKSNLLSKQNAGAANKRDGRKRSDSISSNG